MSMNEDAIRQEVRLERGRDSLVLRTWLFLPPTLFVTLANIGRMWGLSGEPLALEILEAIDDEGSIAYRAMEDYYLDLIFARLAGRERRI